MISGVRSARSDSGCWSRNLRQNNYFDIDSDSGSEPPDSGLDSSVDRSEDQPPPISDDARLIKELDLSSRHDEAVFKPNPWSIAKLGAAVRPQQTVTKNAKAIESVNTRKQLTGKLADAFRKQSLRTSNSNTGIFIKPTRLVESQRPCANAAASSRTSHGTENRHDTLLEHPYLTNTPNSIKSLPAFKERQPSPGYMLANSVASWSRPAQASRLKRESKSSRHLGSQSPNSISSESNASLDVNIAQNITTLGPVPQYDSQDAGGIGSSLPCPCMHLVYSYSRVILIH